MSRGVTMYRLVGFAKQEQELRELVETENRRRVLTSLIKSTRELTHCMCPDRRAGHAYYADALANIKQVLLARQQAGEDGRAPV